MKRKFIAAIAGSMLTLGTARVEAAPVINGTYYEDSSAATCYNLNTCRLNFSVTPPVQYLTITNINCLTATVVNPVSLAVMGVSAASGESSINGRVVYLQPILTSSQNNNISETISNQTFFKIGPSRYPFISIVLTGNSTTITLGCAFSGTLSSS